MKFTLLNGLITKNDEEVADALLSHFSKVYNRNVEVDWIFLRRIKKCEVMHSIGNFMSLEDLDVCLEKLTWHKSPGKITFRPTLSKFWS